MPDQKALLIGIDRYPYLPDFAQLKGCQNDILALGSVLRKKFEFPPENIRMLVNEVATRNNIFEAMKAIVDECGENDSIVFSFSGHGSRLRARKENKPSGWYETIMPFDSGRKPLGTNCDITDDEIYDWLTALSKKTSNILLIFDSCYAGSITRHNEESGTRGIPPDETFIDEAAASPFSGSDRADGENVEAGPSGWLPLSDKYVLFAACAEFERAHVYKEQNGDDVVEYGALSYFLSRALREAPSGTTYRDIWEQVYLNVKTRFEKQNPQLEGNRDRELFGLKEFPPCRYLLVNGRRGKQISLEGGLLDGVRVNSRWEIYPPATKRLDKEAPSLAQIKITAVETLKSKGVVTQTTPEKTIQMGSRAIEVSHSWTKSGLNVWLASASPKDKNQLLRTKQILGDLPFLKITADKDSADVKIHFYDNSAGEETSPVWLLYGQDDSLLIPPRTKIEAVAEYLERLYHYRRIAGLRNPNSSLFGKIDFYIYKQNPDLTWSEVVPCRKEQKLVISESERIALKIVNRFEAPIFFSILDLGLSKKISLLYPPAGSRVVIGTAHEKAAARIEGKGIFTLGMKENECFRLSYPEDLHSVEDKNSPREGMEIFKLLATTRPHDLSFLKHGTMRAVLPPENRFEKLMIDILRGNDEFDKEPLAENENEWLTIEKFFHLRKK